MSSPPVVHIVDDDRAVRESLAILLRTFGLTVQAHGSARAFLDGVAPDGRGCVVTDVQMPEMTGLELLRRLGERGIALPVIVMTGRAERGMAAEAVAGGASAFVQKPFTPQEILDAVERAIGGGAGDS